MGRRGPAAKPTKLKLLAGNPGKQRLNRAEPRFGVDSGCPEGLSLEAQALWATLAPPLRAQGLLTVASAPALAICCQAWADVRECERVIREQGMFVMTERGTPIPHPALRAKRDAEQMFLRYAAQFGLTPASASGVQVAEQGGVDAFDALG